MDAPCRLRASVPGHAAHRGKNEKNALPQGGSTPEHTQVILGKPGIQEKDENDQNSLYWTIWLYLS